MTPLDDGLAAVKVQCRRRRRRRIVCPARLALLRCLLRNLRLRMAPLAEPLDPSTGVDERLLPHVEGGIRTNLGADLTHGRAGLERVPAHGHSIFGP